MTTRNYERKPDPLVDEEAKERKCLRCGDKFMSAGIGNRVCQHCKESTVWRSGTGDYSVFGG